MMTVAIDTSALLCRYLPDARRRFVAEVMAEHDRWVVSALARTETLLALHQAAGHSERHRELWDQQCCISRHAGVSRGRASGAHEPSIHPSGGTGGGACLAGQLRQRGGF